MGDKREARLPPEENEARQAARAAKRERLRNVSVVTIVAALLKIEAAILDSADKFNSRELSDSDALLNARLMLEQAYDASSTKD
jgi:hypothetical protein